MASTWSLVVVVIAVYSPRRWLAAHAAAMLSRCSANGAAMDAVVGCVCVEAGRVAVSQFEGRGCFPLVAESVDGVEFDGAAGGAEFGEHATAADGVELVGVTDQGESPMVLVGENG